MSRMKSLLKYFLITALLLELLVVLGAVWFVAAPELALAIGLYLVGGVTFIYKVLK